MTLVDVVLKHTIFSNRLCLVHAKANFYENVFRPEDIRAIQLKKINVVWKYAYRNILFYSMWKQRHHLPDEIKTLEELQQFPVLTKKDININRELIWQQFRGCKTVSTGGSSGEPTVFPINAGELLGVYVDAYVGRSWWGINPLDSMVSLWGHSHLFGTGISGRIKEFKRRIKDAMINTVQLNAYDMRAETIADYYQEVVKLRPKAIIGYTSCLYKIARYMIDQGLEGTLGKELKVVIPTSESVSGSDVAAMEQAFKRSVAIEYGMAETGVIAYSKGRTDDMCIFWDSFFCCLDKNDVLCVSTLTNKLFPLINYRTDDQVVPAVLNDGSILKIQRIVGRAQESFNIAARHGTSLVVSGILLVHIMKAYQHIYSVQCEQLPNMKVCIHLVSNRQLDLNKVHSYFVSQMSKDHPSVEPSAILFVQSDDVQRSLAGKEKMVWDT